MARCFQGSLLLLSMILILVIDTSYAKALLQNRNQLKFATFLSPKFDLGPGSVENRFYYHIDFPRGHIAIKKFNAEVIDEASNSIPLHETYLHHWVVAKYYQRSDVVTTTHNNHELQFRPSDHIIEKNNGICQGGILRQYFGLGSETRRTNTHVPDPYGIQVGNPADIPPGYDERWLLNVHAIDTRGVEDRLGCTECRCNLYNVTVDEFGRRLKPDYEGGLFCCYDHTQCKVRPGFQGIKRSLYLRYIVEWVDWDASIVPVEIFIFDVTDTRTRLNVSTGFTPENGCQIEYGVEACSSSVTANDGCVDIKRTYLTMPTGGYVIYGVAHQHTGGIGSTLYGEDGQDICTSVPTYGRGTEAGNEAGYIVGMSTCYPKPGSVKIADGERLILESKYNNSQKHTGVMGLFYILVADRTPKDMSNVYSLNHVHERMEQSMHVKGVLVLFGLVITVVIVAVISRSWLKKEDKDDAYEPILV